MIGVTTTIILNNKQIAIIIESENGIKFGGYINSTIDKYSISNPESFLFTFKYNKPMKYPIRESLKEKSIFTLYEDWNNELFSFGNDLIIMKTNSQKQSIIHQRNILFEDNDEKNALIGSSKSNKSYEIKRIVVLQFRSLTEEEKRLKDSLMTMEYIHQIEELSETKCDRKIFDSNKDNWDQLKHQHLIKEYMEKRI